MIKFVVTYIGSDCEISLDTDDAEKPVKRKYSGNPAIVENIKELLDDAYGLFGHTLGENSPAIDVQYALSSPPLSEMLDVTVSEGQDILDKWETPTFPKDAVS